jgi:hypothetical protein
VVKQHRPAGHRVVQTSRGHQATENLRLVHDDRCRTLLEQILVSRSRMCGIPATLAQNFARAALPRGFAVSMSPSCNRDGGVHMTIDTLVLILISTLAVAFVLNRLDMRRL